MADLLEHLPEYFLAVFFSSVVVVVSTLRGILLQTFGLAIITP